MTGLKLKEGISIATAQKEVANLNDSIFDEAQAAAFDTFCDKVNLPCPSINLLRDEGLYPTRKDTMDWVFGKQKIHITPVKKAEKKQGRKYEKGDNPSQISKRR